MGPRSDDRGNVGIAPVVGFDQVLLQWGRDQMIAEIWPRERLYTYVDPRLQWGRDQMIAEMDHLAAMVDILDVCFNGAAIR